MRDFHYAIFDMDGTLIDSMKYWKNLGRDFLIANGCEVPEDTGWILLRRFLVQT